MSSTTRRQNCLKAYTIIESLVVLAILTIFIMVAMALFLHEKESELTDKPLSISSRSASNNGLPQETSPDKKEDTAE